MKLSSLVLSLATFTCASAETIPLDQIWGYGLPGTRDIAGISLPETDPLRGSIPRTMDQFRRQRESSIEQMRRALNAKPPTEDASPGFVLPRAVDYFTLQMASSAVTGMMRYEYKKQPLGSDTFRAGGEITLVFFSHPSSYYVRLRGVARNDNEIKVEYEFEPHASPEVSVHFALIPLGKLPAGDYKVRFEQKPLAKKYRDAGFQPVHPEAFEYVCRPFSFKMWEPAKASPAAGATLIPLDQMWALEIPGTRDVRELEPKADPGLSIDELYRRLDVWKISRVLKNRPKDTETAGRAFVVLGTGKEALKHAEAVFSGAKNRSTTIPPETDVSLVFYSYICGRYVRVVSVEQLGKQIIVKYQFVSHATANSTAHFALIPLGRLSKGTYEVKIEQLESIDENRRAVAPLSKPQRLVSDSCSFEVK